MNNEITNIVLLKHMQAMKLDLKNDISHSHNSLSCRIDRLEQRVENGFSKAKAHRQALQEDLEATILLQGKHEHRLSKIERG